MDLNSRMRSAGVRSEAFMTMHQAANLEKSPVRRLRHIPFRRGKCAGAVALQPGFPSLVLVAAAATAAATAAAAAVGATSYCTSISRN